MKPESLRIPIVLLFLLLVGCSHGTNTTEWSTNLIQPQTGTRFQTEYSVYLTAQQPEQFPYELAPISTRIEEGLRSVSYITADLTKEASSTDDVFTPQNTVVSGTNLEFNPNWIPDAPKPSDLSYAFYTFNLLDYDKEPTVELVWSQKPSMWYSPFNGKSNVWLALGNASNHCWEWFELKENSILTVSSLNEYISKSGKFYLAVVVLGRAVSVLDKIKIGTLEQVVTGLDYVKPNPEYEPDLYANYSLPSTLDLSAHLPEPRAQMPWASGVAFAAADGAYNYTLSQIYQSYGWDKSKLGNQVSPRFVYLESGSHQCGADQGRDLNDTLIGMNTTFGVATELNAPYYTDSCDRNWTLAAKSDAGMLKLDGYKYLHFNSTNVVTKFKQLLYSKFPIVVGIKVDGNFFKYKMGQVWNYSGPELSSHALCIVGWDDAKNAFKARNSWGPTWGDYGYVWINYNTITNSSAGVYAAILWDAYSPEASDRFCGKKINLAPPTKLQGGKGSSAYYVHLSWTKSLTATSYKIFRDSSTNPIATVGDVDYWDDDTVADKYAHIYWVKANNGTIDSELSSPTWGWMMSGGTTGTESETNDYHSHANVLPAVPIAGIKGSVGETDTIDCYSFEAVDKAIYVFTLDYNNATGNAGLKLFDSASTLWQQNNNGNTGQKIIVQGMQKGIYYIDVTYLSKYTDYILSVSAYEPNYNEVENNDDITEATPIVLPITNYHGSIGLQGYDGDNYDYHSFSVLEGQYIRARLTYNNTLGNLYFKLLDGGGNTISSDTNSNPGERLINIGLKKGQYYFYVYPAADATLDYYVTCSLESPGYDEVEDNDAIGTGNTLPAFPFANYFGHIGKESYDGGTMKTDISDYFVFSLAEEKTVTIDLSYDSTNGSNVYLYITDSKGSNLVSDSSGAVNPRKCSKKLAAGNYGVKVYAGSVGSKYYLKGYTD